MKKILKIACFCFLVLFIAFTVSCKKKDGGTAAAEKLIFWVYDADRISTLTEIGKAFERENGVAVEVSLVDLGQIRTQFALASGGADVADLAILPHDNIGPLVENSILAEVNLGAKRSSILDPAINGFTYNGRLYGYPLSVENTGFFYNTSLVPTAPGSWEEAVTIARQLKREGKIDYMMGLPDVVYHIYAIYDAFGGAIFGTKSDGSLDGSQVLLADPGWVAALDFLTGLVKEGLIPETIDWDGAHVLFESGRAAFVSAGPWALDRIKTSGVPFAITKYPAARRGGAAGNPFMGVQGIIINTHGPRRLLAQAFADFILSEANMTALYRADNRPSAWISVFNLATDQYAKGFNDAGVNAIPMPSIPQMGYVWDAGEAAVQLAFSGQRTPLVALQNARQQVLDLSK
jgi:maltose-binding protein MalE